MMMMTKVHTHFIFVIFMQINLESWNCFTPKSEKIQGKKVLHNKTAA